MPWHIETSNSQCNGYAVVKDDNGEVEGCHRSRQSAERQMSALYASENKALDEEYDEKDSPSRRDMRQYRKSINRMKLREALDQYKNV